MPDEGPDGSYPGSNQPAAATVFDLTAARRTVQHSVCAVPAAVLLGALLALPPAWPANPSLPPAQAAYDSDILSEKFSTNSEQAGRLPALFQQLTATAVIDAVRADLDDRLPVTLRSPRALRDAVTFDRPLSGMQSLSVFRIIARAGDEATAAALARSWAVAYSTQSEAQQMREYGVRVTEQRAVVERAGLQLEQATAELAADIRSSALSSLKYLIIKRRSCRNSLPHALLTKPLTAGPAVRGSMLHVAHWPLPTLPARGSAPYSTVPNRTTTSCGRLRRCCIKQQCLMRTTL